MKTRNLKLAILAIASGLILSMVSCKKTELQKETTSAEDQALSDHSMEDVGNQVDNAIDMNSNMVGKMGNSELNGSPCANVTVDTTAGTTFPVTITIDFGPTDCVGDDGITRRGKIIVNLTGRRDVQGSVITTTLDSFYRNDNHIEGTRTVTNEGMNSAGNMHSSVVVSNVVITDPQGETITWASTRDREWIVGASTPFYHQDDVFSITGSGNGVDRQGRSFTMNINEALIKAADCNWISKGIVQIDRQGLQSETIDYGNGSCDNTAVVHRGNHTKTITLH